MEQTTEASQAVDELMPPLPEKTRHNFNVYAHDDEAMRSYALAAIHRYAMKVAAMTTHPFPVIDLNAQPASTEAAQGGKLLELFKLAIGTIAVHDQAEAERIAKMYRSDAVIPASVAAQGEDSARLDADMLALLIREAGILNARGMAWLLNGDSISLNLTNLLAIANMIEDRASAETGGVKP